MQQGKDRRSASIERACRVVPCGTAGIGGDVIVGDSHLLLRLERASTLPDHSDRSCLFRDSAGRPNLARRDGVLLPGRRSKAFSAARFSPDRCDAAQHAPEMADDLLGDWGHGQFDHAEMRRVLQQR